MSEVVKVPGYHECGPWPEPSLGENEEYVKCSCGKVYRGTIIRTFVKDKPYARVWQEPEAWRLREAVKKGLDPSFLKERKRWWQ